MKKTYFSALVLASSLMFACNNASNDTNGSDSSNMMDSGSAMTTGTDTGAMSNNMSTSTDTLGKMDKDFLMEAGAGGNTEMMASKIALERSSNDRVKQFANMMITDHTKAGDELKTLASQKNVMLPDSVMDKQHRALDDLRKESAKNFDKAYIKMMDKDHKETIDKFQKASDKGDNADVKSFATKTLPTLKMHKDSVDAIEKAMK